MLERLVTLANGLLKKAGALPAVAALVLIGGAAVLAAPGNTPTQATPGSDTLQSRFTPQKSSLVAAAPNATATATATAPAPTKKATATPTPVRKAPVAPQATPVPTDTPTDTPTPVPTATPTTVPAPSWHTVGSYSGSAAGNVATISGVPATQVRVTWTCAVSGSLPSWSVMWQVTDAGGNGSTCDSSHTSDSFILPLSGSGPWSVDVQANGPVGSWTATVEVWY